MRRTLPAALFLTLLAPVLAAQPDASPADDLARVRPAFDPGGHTDQILAAGFTADGRKLVTVGLDVTVQVWNPYTGERLDVLRLPGYGRETADAAGRWDAAAVSADGSLVALGGGLRQLGDAKAERVNLLLVDAAKRTVAPVSAPAGKKVANKGADVTAVAFAPNGQRMAVAYRAGKQRTVTVFDGLRDPKGPTATATFDVDVAPLKITAVAFAPDGTRLAVGDGEAANEKYNYWVEVWDVTPGRKPVQAKRVADDAGTTALGWAPDGKAFVRAALGRNNTGRRVELWSADGVVQKKWTPADAIGRDADGNRGAGLHLRAVQFRGPTTVFLAGRVYHGQKTGDEFGGSPYAGLFDTAAVKATRLSDTDFADQGVTAAYTGAISPDGKLTAVTAKMGLDAVVVTGDGKPVARCGVRTPIPTGVGWSADPAAPGFAWTDARLKRHAPTTADQLQFGFDLAAVAPAAGVKAAGYRTAVAKVGDFALSHLAGDATESTGHPKVLQGGKPLYVINVNAVPATTLVPVPGGPPLLVVSEVRTRSDPAAVLYKADGTKLADLKPDPTYCRDIAPSPDGRFLVLSTGNSRLAVYRPAAPATGGVLFPLLNLVTANGEWVCWTQEGYFAASPGGEKMLGWAVQNGPRALVTFHPAEQFAKHFRRPDVIKAAIEKGSVAEALAALSATPANVEAILPPVPTVVLEKVDGGKATVTASGGAGAKDNPVVAMRLLLDGRPLADGGGVLTVTPGKPAAATWTIDVPAGKHELKLLVRSADGAAVSDPVAVVVPTPAGAKPALFRVCVGVDEYDQPGLKLGAAAKDARDVFAALEKDCVGPANRFGAAKGALLVNKDATRAGVLAALAAVRKEAKAGNLLVIFFAGHGVKQGKDFYLLTREADPAADLAGKAISGDDLRGALTDVECPVLLILDACHSAGSVKSFKPATDEVARAVTDDAVGVTVLAAAMAHEVAGASSENGYFTAALLKALAAGEGVPFDPYDRSLFTHHVYSVVFSEVRKATGGKQNPFLNMPWTVPPLPLRDVPER